MAYSSLTPMPDPPLESDNAATFDTKAYATVAAMGVLVTEINDLIDDLAASSVSTKSDDYTLTLDDDSNSYIRMTKATATALTVPLNSSVAFPVGVVILIRQAGAGQVTIVATGGVTINPAFNGTLVLQGAGSTVSLIKVAEDEWDLEGATVAS